MKLTPARRRDLIGILAGLAISVPAGVLYFRTHEYGWSRQASAIAEAAFVFLFVNAFVIRALCRRAREKAANPELIDVDVSDSRVLNCSAQQAWAVLHDPTFASAADDSVTDTMRMPSTPVGPGEVQVFLKRVESTLSISAVEVIEYDPGQFARTRPLVLHKWATEQWTDYRVEPVDADSCRVTIGEHFKFRAVPSRETRKMIEKEAETHRSHCRHNVERLARSLNDGP
ncbi:hypothetical protein Back2_05100 [Nocardioides baekrokdamisoli]|uniref:Coenzyme Q-binding protein COQ10 START domain-containing protein n=1 Tax=Nocardioides baekrokdamisoli TaxID=1804624 RepID=A0A3G9IVB6_9ACTN|nr:SRPBCC family protein [Nocardioides baekrokdamisoli]BBH16223.1 hypothetical protein Back2_05100 [Nocardioides baekrokdamisoli]